ncbi:uncharacterized protein [Arachis hypogaea]|uniref:uncharacterized protein n=1 Tax=Arachis hypogaea TaxID=3818 RepID=UPI0007AFAB3B
MEWGSWLMFNHYLTITRWVPDFNPFGTEINKIAAWVRLPNIPIEYYDKRFLGTVGDHIEKTLKVDMNTANQLRGNFVCQCVELDLSRPLNAKYMVSEKNYHVEYEGFHMICFSCGRFGHVKDGCIEKNSVKHNNGEGSLGITPAMEGQGEGN